MHAYFSFRHTFDRCVPDAVVASLLSTRVVLVYRGTHALGRAGREAEQLLREYRAGRGERAAQVLQPDGRIFPLLAALALGGRVLQRGML